MLEIYEPVLRQLRLARVRHLIVGGMALVLHGQRRNTVDLDLMLDLEPEPLRHALRSLLELGMKSRAPVAVDDFTRLDVRQRWLDEKGMAVFSLWHPSVAMLEVDLLSYHPVDFELAYRRAVWVPLAGNLVAVASMQDLLELKRQAARTSDAADIALLERLLGHRGNR